MGNASMSLRHLATLGIGAASLVLACSPGKLTGESGPPSGGSATDTLFADTFESGALGDPGRWHDIVGNGASIVSAAAEGISAVSGTKVLKLRADGVGMTHFVATGATSPYERLYLSYRVYRTPDFGLGGTGVRMGGIRGSTTQWGSFGVGWGTPGSCPDDPNNVNQQEFMFAYAIQDPGAWALRAYTNWIGEVKLTDNPPTCGGNYANAPGSNPLATYLDVNYVPASGTWHQIEIEVQLNDVGQANGSMRMWADGVLKIEHLNVRYRTTAGMRLWAVTFDTGHVTSGGALYVDDVIVGPKRS